MNRDDLSAMPKIDLHRHFEGSVRLSTLFEISQKYSVPKVSVSTRDELRPLVQVTNSDPHTMQSFLSKFPVLRGFYQSEAIIRRITREIVEDAANDTIKYLELRFSPQALSAIKQFSLEDVTTWVYEESQLAAKEYGIAVNLIIALVRHGDTTRIAQVSDIACDRAGDQIVGIDIAGNEVEYPTKLFIDMFDKAKNHGLGITVHAGEWRNADSVVEAITMLHADRIGHGIAIINDSEALRLVKEKNIALEICPTSNIQTGAISSYGDHPLMRLLQSGALVTLNTDDPAISDITLSHEIDIVIHTLGGTVDDIRRMSSTAVQSSFAADVVKDQLLGMV